jgi:hypothetical protein
MLRLMKTLTIFFALLLTFSLIGCSSTSNTLDAKVKEEQKIELGNEAKESEAANTTNEVKIESKTHVKSENGSSSTNNETKVIDTEKKSEEATSIEEQASSSTKTAAKITAKTPEKQASPSSNKTKSTKDNMTNESSTTTTQKPTTVPKTQNPPPSTVTVTINGPKDIGVILTKTNIPFDEGDTVLDILLKTSKKKNFLVEYRGSGAMAYIEGIDNVYEFDYGPKSGWKFKQNGTKVNKSSDAVKVHKDDQIEWIYSEDFTEEK